MLLSIFQHYTIDNEFTKFHGAISNGCRNSWKWKRKLENITGGSFSCPFVIQAKDRKIHVIYSYHLYDENKSVKQISFEEEWIVEN